MAIPQLLNDIISVLLLLATPAALVSLVLAGISLRREGGVNFLIGGGFTKWMFWSVIFLTLTPLLSWFTSFGVAVSLPSGAGAGIVTGWLANFHGHRTWGLRRKPMLQSRAKPAPSRKVRS